VSTASHRELALRLLPLLDLTSLGEDDTPERTEALCASARSPHGFPAALCVYPEHVTTVRRAMRGTPVKVATVVNFPDGGSDSERVMRETRRAIAAGADEIDMVLPYDALLRGESLLAEAAVRACRDACGEGVALKLIIESGKLAEASFIRQACAIGLSAGVDFLKTSTGKVPVNATPDAATLMLDAIAEAGARCGFKAAGGIRTLDDAQTYLDLAEQRLGADWITPAHFRFGASALFTEITAALAE
jgi:deoxyribose-phosphate aldolase